MRKLSLPYILLETFIIFRELINQVAPSLCYAERRRFKTSISPLLLSVPPTSNSISYSLNYYLYRFPGRRRMTHCEGNKTSRLNNNCLTVFSLYKSYQTQASLSLRNNIHFELLSKNTICIIIIINLNWFFLALFCDSSICRCVSNSSVLTWYILRLIIYTLVVWSLWVHSVYRTVKDYLCL